MTVQAEDKTQQIVEKAVASVGDIATLPEITVKIIEVVEDPKSTARDLHEIIKNDPALSVKVLKVVNSAFYGLPGQIASVDRAIILLGLSAVKNIAIAASIARLFKGGRISKHFAAADLWKHSVSVAVAAHDLAKLSNQPMMANEVFVAGMIHDIGMLVERQVFAESFGLAADRCYESNEDFLAAERTIIGADHQAFGVGLTTKWKFPRHLRATVGFHHCPQALSSDLRSMASLIHIADVLCCQEQIGFYLSSRGAKVAPESLETVALTDQHIEDVRANLAEKIADAEANLGS